MLIIDTDNSYSSELCRCAKSHPAFVDAQFSSNGREGFELMQIIKPDVVIIDFLTPVLDAMGFLRLVKKSNIEKKPFIVINSYTIPQTMLKAATESGADYFMVKPQAPEEVLSTVIDLLGASIADTYATPDDIDELDITITRFLHCMGVPAHLNGYRYIRSSLKLAIENIGALMPITRNLYPSLAKEYNKTPYCIERAIRHAIKVSWERGNKKVISDVFGYSPDSPYSVCPTNSEYIAMAADDLKIRLKHNITY